MSQSDQNKIADSMPQILQAGPGENSPPDSPVSGSRTFSEGSEMPPQRSYALVPLLGQVGTPRAGNNVNLPLVRFAHSAYSTPRDSPFTSPRGTRACASSLRHGVPGPHQGHPVRCRSRPRRSRVGAHAVGSTCRLRPAAASCTCSAGSGAPAASRNAGPTPSHPRSVGFVTGLHPQSPKQGGTPLLECAPDVRPDMGMSFGSYPHLGAPLW